MKVLLVDDDTYIIQALNEKINWHAIGVEQVFSAYNMKQAQKILQEQSIDLLISDIEMPQGSGLELLAWIRGENFNTQAIFLTNYADFNYAQKAIELQSFEYYLKPIDFEKFGFIVQKAIKKIQDRNGTQYSQNLVEENFWHDYLRKPNLENLPTFIQEVQSKELTKLSQQMLQPLILTLQISHEDSLNTTISWSKKLKQDILIFCNKHSEFELATSFKLSQYAERYFFLFKGDEERGKRDFFLALHHYLTQTYLYPVQLLLGRQVKIDNILYSSQELHEYNRHYVGHQGTILTVSDKLYENVNDNQLSLPETSFLSPEKFLASLVEKHPYLTESYLVPVQLLKRLQLDILQKIGTLLDQKGIMAHRLFQNQLHDFLQQRCYNSLEDWLQYIRYYSQTAGDYVQLLESQQSISQVVMDYIDQHFSEELNRKILSDLVFISPDHLARLFKQETGKTLIRYITDKRIETAKKLLTTSQSTVYLIADQVGYDNYSYFSKIFKKVTNLSPLEYRQLYRK